MAIQVDSSTGVSQLLNGIRRQFQQNPILAALKVNGIFYREAPAADPATGLAVRPPYVVIDDQQGPIEWSSPDSNGVTSGSSDVVVLITVYVVDDEEGFSAMQKLRDAFENRWLGVPAHNSTSWRDSTVNKDSPMIWAAVAEFLMNITEQNTVTVVAIGTPAAPTDFQAFEP